MRAVMYHYIRERNKELPNFAFLYIDDFRKQLDFFQKNYTILSKEQFISSVREKKPVPNSIILAFDDGLKDHFTYVLPELKKHGLFGIFYVPTLPYAQHKLLNVHRIHMLLGKFSAQKVYDSLHSLLDDSMVSKEHQDKFSKKLYLKQENDGTAQKVKELLNYYIDYNYRDKVLDTLMQTFFPSEKELANTFYMTGDELKKMQNEGMIIGSHAISHSVMSRLSPQEQYYEIHDSFAFLTQILPTMDFKTFCYPYGGFHTFTDTTESLLKEEGVACSFNVESRDVSADDLALRPQALPRYDCNEFPNGQIYRKAKQ